MFAIPGQDPVTLTDAAAKQVARLMEKDNRFALKIGVKKGGCAGMEYTMDFVDAAEPNDVEVTHSGARVLIAPMAQMFLFGTQIDYETGLLDSGFRFNNPNVVDACGCGESIKFDENLTAG